MENWLFLIHVIVVILGMACFLIAFLSSLAYLLRQRQLKRKRLDGPWKRLPSLEQLDRWALRAVVLGFIALTLGIGLGFFLAHVAWPEGWIVDPKVSLSMTTWVWFFATLVLRGRFGWRGTRFFIFIVIGFILALIIFFGFSIYGVGSDPTAAFQIGSESCTLFCLA